MIYINTKDGHYKFWGYTLKEVTDYSRMDGFTNMYPKVWIVTTYWGKIGFDLDTCPRKDFSFDQKWQATSFIEDKLREKRGKGYDPLDQSYKSLVNGDQPRQAVSAFEVGLQDLAKKIDLF